MNTIAVAGVGEDDFQSAARDRAADQDCALVAASGLFQRAIKRFEDFRFSDAVIMDMRLAVGIGVEPDLDGNSCAVTRISSERISGHSANRV